MSRLNLKFIVTGTGRCGTVFMAKFLTSAGIPCSHEGMFTTQGLEFARKIAAGEKVRNSHASGEKWQDEIVADSSYMAAPYLKEFPEAKTIHVVRNPMRVINSFHCEVGTFYNDYAEEQEAYRRFIYQFLPELAHIKSELLRAVYYVVEWNKIIERQKPNFLHMIESNSNKLLDFLQVKERRNLFGNKEENSWAGRPRHNKKQRSRIGLSDIPSGSIKTHLLKQMGKYGYAPKLF